MAQGVHQAVKSTKLGAGKGRISHVKKTHTVEDTMEAMFL